MGITHIWGLGKGFYSLSPSPTDKIKGEIYL
nr:MAG TPA: nucleoporin [Caudoviricetes sp.]